MSPSSFPLIGGLQCRKCGITLRERRALSSMSASEGGSGEGIFGRAGGGVLWAQGEDGIPIPDILMCIVGPVPSCMIRL